MSVRSLICAAVTLLACSSCSVTNTGTPQDTRESKNFRATIAGIERSDPASPAALIAQLSYAEFLLSRASGPACTEWLEQAAEQLGSINANPKSNVMFPDGWAHAVDLEYRLHLARADCGGSGDASGDRRGAADANHNGRGPADANGDRRGPADANNELLIAVASARRAVDLYREMFDYRSMVIMQFDTAVVLRRLGENATALTALEKVLDMDREYGFDDDARENYTLLLTWRGETADAAHVDSLMRDFPKRTVTLTFGWHPMDAEMRFESQRESLENGQIMRGRAAAEFERRIVADADGGWSVTYAHRLTRYEPGVWPAMEISKEPPTVFSAPPLPVGFNVTTAGEFDGVTDFTEFSANLIAKTQEVIRATTPSGEGARKLADQAVETATSTLSPGVLEAVAAENYQLETAMWIGATLEQGVWREISAPLSLPGMPRVVVQNNVQFAFTHMVPCSSARTVATCAEIVMRVVPDKGDLDQIMADFALSGGSSRLRDYMASTQARIVVDPKTLLPYTREERVYWYASVGKGPKDALIRSEHLVSTTR